MPLPTNHQTNQWLKQPTDQHTTQPPIQPNYQPFNPPTKPTNNTNQPTNKQIYQPINQPSKQATNKSTHQQIHPASKQPTNKCTVAEQTKQHTKQPASMVSKQLLWMGRARAAAGDEKQQQTSKDPQPLAATNKQSATTPNTQTRSSHPLATFMRRSTKAMTQQTHPTPQATKGIPHSCTKHPDEHPHMTCCTLSQTPSRLQAH